MRWLLVYGRADNRRAASEFENLGIQQKSSKIVC